MCINEGTKSRRDFHKLALAAVGGMLAGTAGCRSGDEAEDDAKYDPNLLADEPHVCRGLNTCKGLDKTGGNACAGQGDCATANKHSCHEHNECKGQGGCGLHPGENLCKGQGECAVPLRPKTWERARKKFEEVMAGQNKPFGAAPAT